MNRRDFLKTVGVGAGAALIGGKVIEALAAPDLPGALGSVALADQRDPVAHILNRVTFGPRPGQVEAVKKMGVQAYLEQQLKPESIPDDASENRLGDYITLDMQPAELTAFAKQPAEVIAELDSATVMRAVYSERQLYEIMVNFWSEHFSIYHLKNQCKFLKTADDRDVIRKHALGKFRDLLGASTKSPAMLIYLDNAESEKKHPNENYAREVMELHTITIGNYTEDDVKEVARCFTGWTIQGLKGDNPGEFIFRPNLHDNDAKMVLGHAIAAGGGIQDGETVLDLLASHPNTAELISNKLCRRFIADDPPDAVVKAGAQAFLSSGGDIPSVLRVIFASQEFLNAPAKFKRPFEYLVSLYRVFNVELPAIQANDAKKRASLASLGILKGMGHLPFNHIEPNGYSDYASTWIVNMLLRWNAAIQTVYGQIPGSKIDLTGLAQSQGVDLNGRSVLAFYGQHLLGRPLTQAEQDTIWNFASKKGEPDLTTPAGRLQMRNAIAVIAASPAFQYR
ncbi:MAG: DUF1800 family protein [Chloroflexota bacterium]